MVGHASARVVVLLVLLLTGAQGESSLPGQTTVLLDCTDVTKPSPISRSTINNNIYSR